MTVYRCILPNWKSEESPGLKKVQEGQFTEDQIKEFNNQGYNIYYLPNYPSMYEGGSVEGFQIDTFTCVFVDMDLKDGHYKTKEAFYEALGNFPLEPSTIVDSGNGVHAYWTITDLDATSYLKLSRRLMRHLKTDEAVGQIYQLMRLPGTLNTKNKEELKLCEVVYVSYKKYTCEELSKELEPLSLNDEQFCKQHYEKTYKLAGETTVDDRIPPKFHRLLNENLEVQDIWKGKTDDRSKADFRLGHLLFANGFTKEEAASVLVNTAKALARSQVHRLSYAMNIIDKIWTYEANPEDTTLELSQSVEDIFKKTGENLKGERLYGPKYLDNTAHGFRIGHVLGLVAGVGVGKTAVALNMFLEFVQKNPEYDHFFVPLEQPAHEIAERWRTICGPDTQNHKKVQVLSNYNADGSYRNLSLEDIQEYIIKYKKVTGRAVGCVVIDHIGILKKNSREGKQSIEDICHKMKSFAVATETLLVMQSQAPRHKAGIGDLELDKDAAYGTVFFEAYCDYLVTVWQPLKRVYKEGAPTVTSFKFCKIRHKKQNVDVIKEDVNYKLMFDTETERLRPLNPSEKKAFDFFLARAKSKRMQDKASDIGVYEDVDWEDANGNGTVNTSKNLGTNATTEGIH